MWLATPPPSPLAYRNHGVRRKILDWSLILKDLYQSLERVGLRGCFSFYGPLTAIPVSADWQGTLVDEVRCALLFILGGFDVKSRAFRSNRSLVAAGCREKRLALSIRRFPKVQFLWK